MKNRKQNRKFNGSPPSSNGQWFTDEVQCAITRGIYMPPGNKTPARWPEFDEIGNLPDETQAPTAEPGSAGWLTRLLTWFKTCLLQGAAGR